MGLQIRRNGPAYEILVPEVVSQYLNIHEQLPSPMFGLSLFLLPNFVYASSAGASEQHSQVANVTYTVKPV